MGWLYSNAHCCSAESLSWPKPCCSCAEASLCSSWPKPCFDLAIRSLAVLLLAEALPCWSWPKPCCAGAAESSLASPESSCPLLELLGKMSIQCWLVRTFSPPTACHSCVSYPCKVMAILPLEPFCNLLPDLKNSDSIR